MTRGTRRRMERLASLLRTRERALDRARVALAGALEQAVRLERERAHWDGVADATRDQLSAQLAEGMNAGLMVATGAAIDHAREKSVDVSGAIVEAERTIVAAREDVVAAKKNVRALELLRDRRAREARVAEERVVQQQLDEVGARVSSNGELA